MADLFYGLAQEEKIRLSNCLSSFTKKYKKGETVEDLGFETHIAGFIKKGKCELQIIDSNGNVSIPEILEEDDIFAKSLLFSDYLGFLVSVIAAEDCEIAFIDEKKLLTPCKNACDCHNLLIKKVMSSVMRRAGRLSSRINILSKKNTREKLIEYFKYLSEKQNSSEIYLPMSVSETADFLCVNRSAMTREIKKMKDEGIIKTDKRLVKFEGEII